MVQDYKNFFSLLLGGLAVFALLIPLFIIRHQKIKSIFEILVMSCGVSGFLIALNFFSSIPSINIDVVPILSGYKVARIREFYKINQIDFPQFLSEHYLINTFSNDETKGTSNHYRSFIISGDNLEQLFDNIGGYSNNSLMKNNPKIIQRLHNISELFNITGKFLEGHFLSPGNVKELLNGAPKSISSKQKWDLIKSLFWAKEFNNIVNVKNDGDIDLKEVNITISAPIGQVKHDRHNNILGVYVFPNIIHKVIVREEATELYLPQLRKGERVTLFLSTKEKEIVKEEIISSYKADPHIVLEFAVITTLIIFFWASILIAFIDSKDAS